MEEKLTHYNIVKKLIGPIDPLGDSNRDKDRLNNLKATIELVDLLLNDIEEVANYSNSYEASVKEIGKLASDFYYNKLADPNFE